MKKQETARPSPWLQPPYEPKPVDNLMLAFPADVRALMPKYEDIPDEFHMGSSNKWVKFQADWFYRGLDADVQFYMQDGIDGNTAFRHLKAIQGSFQPKHEHKVAAVAFLASRWFTRVQYTPTKR